MTSAGVKDCIESERIGNDLLARYITAMIERAEISGLCSRESSELFVGRSGARAELTAALHGRKHHAGMQTSELLFMAKTYKENSWI